MEEVSIFNTILQTALGMGIVQWLAFVFSIAYVILAAKENIWCWPIGLIGVVLAFVVYIDPEVRLYSDAALQIFYMVMSVYGWWAWRKQSNELTQLSDQVFPDSTLSISRWPVKNHLLALVAGSVLAVFLGEFWTYMNAALPYIDAFTTSFSMIATFMVTRKILENWLYWIVIDFVCIFVYIHRGIYLFSILFFIYCIIAIFGYFKWKRQLNEAQL